MKCPGGLWVTLLLAVIGSTAAQSEGEYDPLLEILEEGKINFNLQPSTVTDKFGEAFNRSTVTLGILPDDEWEGLNRRKIYRINDIMKVEQSSGTGFRSHSKCKRGQKKQDCAESRGSDKNVLIPPKPFPHKPHKDEVEGCGNPICVILDSKPRRFHSVCSLIQFLKSENRAKDYINFIQKGDCYDIIDNANPSNPDEGGATHKKWIDHAPKNCKRCKHDKHCNEKVIFVIDILNVLEGKSSAPGGGIFSETKHGSNKKHGMPFEFSNICEAMKFFASSDNINKKTQVMGFGLGNVCEIFSTHSGEKCLWTEWFDLDTPCNADEEKESHSKHYERLMTSYTGPMRICRQKQVTHSTHQGGSEWTQIPSDDAESIYKQTIQATKYSIQCRNKDNEEELPAPFIFNQKKNTTCLDYKTRYCCKMSEMWRPVTIESIVNQLPATPPIGLTTASWTVPPTAGGYSSTEPKDGDNAPSGSTMSVDFRVYDGQKDSKVKEIRIEPPNAKNLELDPQATFVGYIKNGPQDTPQAIKGNFTERKFPDGSVEVVYSVYVDGDPTKEDNKDPGPIATITIKTDPSSLVKRIENTKIVDHSSGLKTDTSLNIDDVVNNYDFEKYPFDETKYKSRKEQALSQTTDWHYEATITDPQGGVKTIDLDTMGPPHDVKSDTPGTPTYTGSVMPSPKPSSDIWKKISDILQAYSINTLVESPPLATIFHECTWKDWINLDYPGMTNNNSEYELKHLAFKHSKGKFKQHVCGNQDDDVHYIDAVTMDTQTPWHELKMDSGKKYETYKIAPTFGYVCKDENGEPGFCKDMKVRYCCANKQTAAWGDWGAWGTCSKTCGGGVKIRKRDCEQLSVGSKTDSKYNNQCFGQGLDKQMQKRYSEESTDCNINECPTDHQFDTWTPWTSCTVTCNKGHKYRKRNCKAARGGGKECPPYETNKDLYELSAQCTQADCETFSPGPWTPWSACSTTCGKGQRSKTRKCISNLSLQVAADENCHTDLSQVDACKTRDCPVDGSWTTWGLWSVCSQNCIEHPDSAGYEGGKKPENTKAFMHRERHCANPRPAHHGKSCARDKSKEFLSETGAERERRPCYTENDKDIPRGAKPTPWCPQHCIYTLWSEWSACDKTCLCLDGFIDTTPENAIWRRKIAKNFGYILKGPGPSLPLRKRMKCLMREERFGGACPEKLDNMNNPGTYNGSVIWQNEECTLCKEHCQDIKNPLFPDTDIRNFPALDYPGNDKACVGYCPISCDIDIIEPDPTCEENLHEYLENEVNAEDLQKDYEKTFEGINEFHVDGLEGGCFPSRAIIAIMAWEYEDDTQKMMREYLGKVVDGKIPKDTTRACWDNAELKKIQKHLEHNHSKTEKEDLSKLLAEDCEKLQELLWETYKEQPRPPIYDGLFGGKHCYNKKEKKTISTKLDLDKKKYTREIIAKFDTIGRCHVDICKMDFTRGEPGIYVPVCPYTKWTQWGPWGTCNLKCGREGIRKSIRQCVSSCNEEEVHANAKCRPIVDKMRNLTWTNEFTEPCDPCPPSKEGMWSSWSEWAFENQPSCNPGKEPLQNVRTRSRTCMHSDVKKCEPNKDGQTEGKEVESTFHDMPFCKEGGYTA